MEQVGAGERLGRQVRGFHQFQRGLPSRWVGVAVCRADQPRRETLALGQFGDMGVLAEQLLTYVAVLGRRRAAAADPVEEQVQREQQ